MLRLLIILLLSVPSRAVLPSLTGNSELFENDQELRDMLEGLLENYPTNTESSGDGSDSRAESFVEKKLRVPPGQTPPPPTPFTRRAGKNCEN